MVFRNYFVGETFFQRNEGLRAPPAPPPKSTTAVTDVLRGGVSKIIRYLMTEPLQTCNRTTSVDVPQTP